MIENILKNRRYVREYDTTANISESLVDELLQKTWKVTPSKNNFMPYTVHVLGPQHQHYKELVYLNAASNEGRTDNLTDPLDTRYTWFLPNYANILNCSYLFIFTLRLEDSPNPHQQQLLDRGHRYEAVDEERLDKLYPTASLEVGLFANTLSALFLENNIDVSYTLCFQKQIDKWANIPFVTRKPILLMTAGKGKVYLDEQMAKHNIVDPRPDYHRIINFVN